MIKLSPPSRQSTLISHEFDHSSHIYKVAGEFVLATSDVIELNMLNDNTLISDETRRYAGHRGSALHQAVEAYENKRSPEEAIKDYEVLHQVRRSDSKLAPFLDDTMQRFSYYLNWRKDHDITLSGKMELTRVYRHVGTEHLIGATIDLPVILDNQLTVIDLKTAHKQYGQKALTDTLKWKLQTQSYKEALEAQGDANEHIGRAILHLHPQCGKNGVRGAQTGWEWHDYSLMDDSFIWDAAIRIAMAKLSHGYKLNRRDTVIDQADSDEAAGKYAEENRKRVRKQFQAAVEADQGITNDDVDWWYQQHPEAK